MRTTPALTKRAQVIQAQMTQAQMIRAQVIRAQVIRVQVIRVQVIPLQMITTVVTATGQIMSMSRTLAKAATIRADQPAQLTTRVTVKATGTPRVSMMTTVMATTPVA